MLKWDNNFTQLNLKFISIYRLNVFLIIFIVGLTITGSLILKPVFKSYKRPVLWSNVITHVHNDYFFRSTIILWKILYLILFGHSKTDFVWYLICIYLPQDWTELTVSEMVEDVKSIGQWDCFKMWIFWVYSLHTVTLGTHHFFCVCVWGGGGGGGESEFWGENRKKADLIKFDRNIVRGEWDYEFV